MGSWRVRAFPRTREALYVGFQLGLRETFSTAIRINPKHINELSQKSVQKIEASTQKRDNRLRILDSFLEQIQSSEIDV